ncbi:PQQ-binding-like beta-propeller repeat protein [Nocardia cyriacigeorgica]|uniref:PQQ-binding-like beta-propeller repeat protein n=2 Tax=Nocardia cyriacigeorgica TaxID=135487 RepID=A0A6P1DBG6_9NOCA|nr:PQQ-binding-like beta-propeller repeat protein [Nocardia cyriacigeorgica]NEW47478.1 PQQ-binding-like beta-propeller repeat protein [Nocardia cyriacigeorgica]NEW52130.1 PQQ-binding-like beta-propeller repeat protein [Nocardia cyriacigeorgica]NEW57024.1 PQQ-binding-like beta-propeller repeat protein [Nocardia cyriacigeorgica]
MTTVAAALLAVGAVVLTGCGTDVDDITVGPGLGWPGPHHDGHNSGTSPVTGAHDLTLSWSRPVGGPIATPVGVAAEGQMFVTTRTPTGCNIFSLQMPTGRKRFCNPLGPNAISSPTVIDGLNNVYVGDDSGVSSINYLGQPRWRTAVAGVPVSLQFTGDSNLLTITQTGQLDVLSRQTGRRLVPTMQLLGQPDYLELPALSWPASGDGLVDCRDGGPQCAVANVSPIDTSSGRFYVTVWRPGEARASLVALRYGDGAVEQLWSTEMLEGGSATSPALSADGSTVYVGDNSNRLIAVDAVEGSTKWVHPLEWTPRRGISVSGDGLIIPAGDEGYLLALRDNGDSVESVWERKDLTQRGTPAQTAGHTGYTVAAIGEGLDLITFDTETGETLDSDALPGASGTTTGTSVSADGEVVVATRIGEIFVFAPQG